MKILILVYFLIIHYALLSNTQKGEALFEGEIDEEETIYTGKVIKYLNITEILQNHTEVEDEDEDIFISATQKKFKDNFYNQLNSSEKSIYDELYILCNRMDPELSFSMTINKYIDKNNVNIERLMTCFVYDNPKFWWIESYNIGIRNTFEKNEKNDGSDAKEEYDVLTIITVNFITKDTIFPDLTNEKIYEMNKELYLETDMLLYQIELLNLHTKFEVLKYIHDYVIRNTVYVDDGEGYVHTLCGPLVQHKSICSGYSEVFRHIASYFGINVIIARSLTHEWNYALVNDKWYIIDVTWDDPAVSKHIFNETLQAEDKILYRPEKGDYTNLSYDYFLVGTDVFEGDEQGKTDHDLIYSYFSLKNLVVYPEIEKYNFVREEEIDEYVERIPEVMDEEESSHHNITDSELKDEEEKSASRKRYDLYFLTLSIDSNIKSLLFVFMNITLLLVFLIF